MTQDRTTEIAERVHYAREVQTAKGKPSSLLDDWEVIGRCINRLKPADTFTASWTSYLAGLATSALVAFVTVRYTVATRRAPHTGVQNFLALLTVFATLSAILIYVMERRERRSRHDVIKALRDEYDAAEQYMREIEKTN